MTTALNICTYAYIQVGYYLIIALSALGNGLIDTYILRHMPQYGPIQIYPYTYTGGALPYYGSRSARYVVATSSRLCRIKRSVLQNIVSFIRLFRKRDLQFEGAY